MNQFFIGAAIWYGFGVYSHIHWWRKKHDYYLVDLVMSLATGIGGPINWIVGWVICGESSGERRLLFKRSQGTKNAD